MNGKWAALASASLLLSACGGGPANNAVGGLGTIKLLNPPAGAPAQSVDVLSVNTGGGARTQSGTMTGNTLTGSVAAGTLDTATGLIALASGGNGKLIAGRAGSNEHFLFSAGSVIGVVGVPATAPASGTFTTDISAVINDGSPGASGTYSGTGTLAANFGSGTADLSSTVNGPGGSTTLDLLNAGITGTIISGGQMTVSGPFVVQPSNSAVAHRGGFFGAGAAEVGGAYHLDRIISGDRITVTGTYSGVRK